MNKIFKHINLEKTLQVKLKKSKKTVVLCVGSELMGDDACAMRLGNILAKLELYRHTVERMLSAPFGSIILYEMEHLAAVLRGLALLDS